MSLTLDLMFVNFVKTVKALIKIVIQSIQRKNEMGGHSFKSPDHEDAIEHSFETSFS